MRAHDEQMRQRLVGGGQAGLVISHLLTQQGREHLVLEPTGRHIPGTGAGTPSRSTRFPAARLTFPACRTRELIRRYAYRDEVIAYFEAYVAHVQPPLCLGARHVGAAGRPRSLHHRDRCWHAARQQRGDRDRSAPDTVPPATGGSRLPRHRPSAYPRLSASGATPGRQCLGRRLRTVQLPNRRRTPGCWAPRLPRRGPQCTGAHPLPWRNDGLAESRDGCALPSARMYWASTDSPLTSITFPLLARPACRQRPSGTALHAGSVRALTRGGCARRARPPPRR